MLLGALLAIVFLRWFLFATIRLSDLPFSLQMRVCIGKYMIWMMAAAATGLVDSNGLATLALIPASVVLFAPTFVLVWIVVPLRMSRVAYWTARIFRPLNFVQEPIAAGVIYGALALARKRPSTKSVDWLDQKFSRAPVLFGGGVVAAGLLAALRDDRDRARCLFLVANAFAPKLISQKARAIARDWLIADAARNGRWREVIRLGRPGQNDLSWSHAVARIAERLVGRPDACGNWLLWLYWIDAPRRRLTRPLFRRALAVPRRAKPSTAEQAAATDLPHALADLADAFQRRQGVDGQLLALRVYGVSAALERPDTRAHIQQRLEAVGAQYDVEAVVAGVRSRLVDRLAVLMEDSPHFARGDRQEPIADDAIARVRRRLFKDIEAHCADYRARRNSESALKATAEWEVWASLRYSADRLLTLDPASETALFELMWPVCNNFAVFQHNACQRLALAHDMYSWLHLHAQSNRSASELLAKNVSAALSGLVKSAH